MLVFQALLLSLPNLIQSATAYTALTDETLKRLPTPGDDFDIHNGALLAPILIPRVPGSPGSTKVLQHFVDFFTNTLPDWKLSFQNSTSTTPTSNGEQIPFRNLIATRDPPWAHGEGDTGRLVLVAHYDSKLTPKDFIGATDSAAPCAMIMHAARSIDAALTKKWESMQAAGLGKDGAGGLEEHKGVQVLLLDGEEAFKVWTHTDSLYGARSLAEEWEASFYPANSNYRTPLHSMDLFVLLDLLGAKNPKVPSYFKTTHWAYQNMAKVEKKLRDLKIFGSDSSSAFLPEMNKKDSASWLGGMVEDDHLPFLARGVEILHLITSPFPAVWHTAQDDGEHLDIPTVIDWAMLTTAFTAEWLDLDGFFEPPKQTAKRAVDEKDELIGSPVIPSHTLSNSSDAQEGSRSFFMSYPKVEV